MTPFRAADSAGQDIDGNPISAEIASELLHKNVMAPKILYLKVKLLIGLYHRIILLSLTYVDSQEHKLCY